MQEYVRILRLDTGMFNELVGDLSSLENVGTSYAVDICREGRKLKTHWEIVPSLEVQQGTTGARMYQPTVMKLSRHQCQDIEAYVNAPNTPEYDVANTGMYLPYLTFVCILGSCMPPRCA